MKKIPEIRVKVVAVDRLLLLTEAQLKVWLWYKRREGVDGKAYGKAKTIADACGFTQGNERPERKELPRVAGQERLAPTQTARAKVGLPMFLAVIPRLTLLGASEGNPQITPPVIVGLTPPSSTYYTEVVSLEVATLKDSALTSGKEERKEPFLASLVTEGSADKGQDKDNPARLGLQSEEQEQTQNRPELDLHPSVWSLERIWHERTERNFTGEERVLANGLILAYRFRVVEAVLRNTLWQRPKSAKLRWNKFAVFAKHWERNHEEYLAYCASGGAGKAGGTLSPVRKFDPVPKDGWVAANAKEYMALVNWFKSDGKIGEYTVKPTVYGLPAYEHGYVAMKYLGDEGRAMTKEDFVALLLEVGKASRPKAAAV